MDDKKPLFEELIDHCVRNCQLADLEAQFAAGASMQELDKWNLTPEEWVMAMERAIKEYKEFGPRGTPKS